MSEIPRELAGVVRAAAAAAPPHPGDLAGVRRRARVVSRRRTVTATGLVALGLLAMLGFGPPADRQPPEPARPAQPTPTPPVEPAQRLLIDGTGYVLQVSDGPVAPEPPAGLAGRALQEWYADQPGATGVLGVPAEVLPNGTVVELDLEFLPGINNGVNDVVAMPDGRLAAIGLVDTMPGLQRADGPCVEGLEFRLLVLDAEGSVSVNRNVQERCHTLDLLAADAETAYLVRGSRLVAHDFASGVETVLLDSPALAEFAARSSFAAGRLATIVEGTPAGPACAAAGLVARIRVDVVALTDQATTHRLPTGAGCGELAGPVRLSPNGEYVAVAYHRSLRDGGGELRLAVLHVTTGRVAVDQLVIDSGEVETVDTGPMSVGNGAGAIAGMAWQDNATLRYAWYETPEQGVHRLPDLIQVGTVTLS